MIEYFYIQLDVRLENFQFCATLIKFTSKFCRFLKRPHHFSLIVRRAMRKNLRRIARLRLENSIY